MILNDKQIAALCVGSSPMISPFHNHQIKTLDDQQVISFGVSSFGYDIRMADEVGYYKQGATLDPKKPREIDIKMSGHGQYVMPSNSTVLTRSIEYFDMPPNVSAICVGKSTYARVNVFANITPLEAGWRGYLTIELANLGANPVVIYANEGIAQLLFLQGERPAVTYADRKGKYQDQPAEIIGARL